MKKILVGLMVLVLGAGVVFATSTNTYTNALGQIVTVRARLSISRGCRYLLPRPRLTQPCLRRAIWATSCSSR